LSRALDQADQVGESNVALVTAEVIAQLYRLEGSHAESARHYAAAEVLRGRAQLARTWFQQQEYETSIAALRLQLDAEAYEQAVSEGRRMSLDQLVRASLPAAAVSS
jgi:hypothetical protein